MSMRLRKKRSAFQILRNVFPCQIEGVANAPHLQILNPDFVGCRFPHQPEGSFLTLRRRRVANAPHLQILDPDFVGEGKKPYGFLINGLAQAGRREGHQLRPQVPLPGVPLGRRA